MPAAIPYLSVYSLGHSDFGPKRGERAGIFAEVIPQMFAGRKDSKGELIVFQEGPLGKTCMCGFFFTDDVTEILHAPSARMIN